ncbi:MAG TPA: biotin carboxylase N-terminal domain-containing protein [Steroidobacteraceae bacterium]|nr:biotin carboxylase N-terminal domain-containing protein [Steroidobacteraceae bacterium]
MFRKLLIANRGEIACRIARTARCLGVAVVAVYSQADARARHVRLADEAWPLGCADAEGSYLDRQAILDIAERCGAEAIHPGYGFLSENEAFAAACAAAGIVFVGPPAAAIAAMGDKATAKERMRRAGVPVLAGYEGEDQGLAALERRGRKLGFPLIIKPSGGGGGKGMQIVRAPAELRAALESARRIAMSAFADERLLLERYLPAPRHIEVQVLADRHGRILQLLDRDCSVQRRHQKLIEEAPAPGLDAPLRSSLAAAACTVAREVAYEGAGTVEFLLDGGEFFFMEMNTRLQVEHPVTEAITGLDLVEWQLRIAAGEPLAFAQPQIAARGHAVEVRVCAEDPAQDFLPGAGRLQLAVWPRAAEGVRVDAGFETGDAVSPHYDSLLGKIIAHAPTRAEALSHLRSALAETLIAGVPTNVAWLAGALESAEFRAGPVDTGFADRRGATVSAPADATGDRGSTDALAPLAAAAYVFALQSAVRAEAELPHSPWALADGFRLSGCEPIPVRLESGGGVTLFPVRVRSRSRVEVLLSDTSVGVELEGCAPGTGLLTVRTALGGARAQVLVGPRQIDVWRDARHASMRTHDVDDAAGTTRRAAGSLSATLPGVVVSVLAGAGQQVAAGQVLLVVEAMKMEHAIRAPQAGAVATVHVRVGDRVREGETLVTMQSAGEAGA